MPSYIVNTGDDDPLALVAKFVGETAGDTRIAGEVEGLLREGKVGELLKRLLAHQAKFLAPEVSDKGARAAGRAAPGGGGRGPLSPWK